jgi:stress-induced morphogen
LKDNFPGGEVTLENTSSQHIGHNARGMHLKTTITFSGFAGKSTLEQHRMVHAILKEEIGDEIHAITIDTSSE